MKSCQEIKIPAGSDADFRLSVVDENGTPINLAIYANVMVIVYTAVRVPVAKFSVLEVDEWGVLEIVGDGDELDFSLTTAQTMSAKGNKLLYEIRTQVELGLGVAGDGVADNIVTDEYLCTITNSMVTAVPSA
jgi:hypothetical protein